jgi:hypothetical protein
MNRILISALVPIALAACGSSETTAPAESGSTQGAVAANAVSVKVTGMT